MLRTRRQAPALQELKAQIANRIAEYGISPGKGTGGTLEIGLVHGAVRVFRSHWTGFRIAYTQPIILMKATLADGSFWSEGYISPQEANWVLCFRKQPHKSRGTGAERPDDKFTSPQAIETSQAIRRQWVEEGLVADEEIIRYEDFDSASEAIDEFFNYTSFYCLRAVEADWSQFGFVVDAALDWDNIETQPEEEEARGPRPSPALVDEALRKSDILWLTPDTDPGKAIPCWFVYSKDKKLYVLSGEVEQRIPFAANVRRARVVVRWKGRDAQMVKFDAKVTPITSANRERFEEVAQLLVAKRQSVRAGAAETISSWLRDGVILDVAPEV